MVNQTKNRKERKYKVSLFPEHVKIIKENGLPFIFPVDMEIIYPLKDDAVPEVYGKCMGYMDPINKEYASYFKNDKNAEILKKYIELGIMMEKYENVIDQNNDKSQMSRFYLMYKVNESSKYTPTYTELGPQAGTSILDDVVFVSKFEVLIAEDNLSRRFVFKQRSSNIPMFEWLDELKDNLESLEWKEFDNISIDGMSSQFYEENQEIYFTMFNEVGRPIEVNFDRNEFVSMIKSVRQISCELVPRNSKE